MWYNRWEWINLIGWVVAVAWIVRLHYILIWQTGRYKEIATETLRTDNATRLRRLQCSEIIRKEGRCIECGQAVRKPNRVGAAEPLGVFTADIKPDNHRPKPKTERPTESPGKRCENCENWNRGTNVRVYSLAGIQDQSLAGRYCLFHTKEF